jgi:hypothetical protein
MRPLKKRNESMQKRKRWRSDALSLFVLFVGFIGLAASLLIPLLHDRALDPSWVQAGSTIALLAVTFGYARSTEKAARESEQQRRIAQDAVEEARRQEQASLKILEEARRARAQSVLPIVVLRSSTTVKHPGVPHYAVIWAANVGSGPAINIEARASALRPMNADLQSTSHENHWRYSSGFQPNQLLQGAALGPGDGSLESGAIFIEQNTSMGSLLLPMPGFATVVLYDDVRGAGYCSLTIAGETTIRLIYHPRGTAEERRERRKKILDEPSPQTILQYLESCPNPLDV